MPDLSQIETKIKTLTFPLTKDELISKLQIDGVNPQALSTITMMFNKSTYNNADDVMSELKRISPF